MASPLSLQKYADSDRFMLQAIGDCDNFGVKGFCLSFEDSSELRKKLKEKFYLEYENNSNNHQKGDETVYLVSASLNSVPGLKAEVSGWNSQADCALKWDLILHWEEHKLFFPLQVKSSKQGVILSCFDFDKEDREDLTQSFRSNPTSFVVYEIDLEKRFLDKLKKVYQAHEEYQKSFQESDKEEKRNIPGYTEKIKNIQRLRKIQLECETTYPLYVWADSSMPQESIHQIIGSFASAFKIDCDITSIATSAFDEFQKSKEKIIPKNRNSRNRNSVRTVNSSLRSGSSSSSSPSISPDTKKTLREKLKRAQSKEYNSLLDSDN
jgi:hypothetical protein